VLKGNPSRWMNDPGVRFGWQEGYFACSVSRSKVPTVRHYIASQKEHQLIARAAFMPSLTGLGILSFPFPGTAVPGYRLFRPYGTGPARLDIVPFYRRLIAIQTARRRQRQGERRTNHPFTTLH
jgi:hypothetical protein